MANTFKLKRSAVQGKVPTTGDLQLGELALNTYDGKLYTKKDDGTATIVEIGSAAGVSDGDKGDITVASGGTNWTIDNSVITDVKVASGAAIAGTKISPNFGSQDIVTSGNVAAAKIGLNTPSTPTSDVHIYQASGEATMQFERGSTSLVAADRLGVIDFISNDNSTNANGSRVRVYADVSSTTGTGRFVIQTKGGGSTVFSERFSASNTGVSAGTVVAGTVATTSSLQGNLNNNVIVWGSQFLANTDTQIDIDITAYFPQASNRSSYVEFTVVGLYDNGAGTYSRLHKRWAQHLFWTGTTWTIAGANLLGTAYNTDATNFPAGAVNASKVLSVVSGTTFLLRLQNRTSPASGSSTYYEYNVNILSTI